MDARRAIAVVGASLLATWGVVGAVPAAAAPPAAGSIQNVAGTLLYTAYPGFANTVDVAPDGLGDLDVVETAGPIDLIGPACVPNPSPGLPYKLTCDRAGVTTIRLEGDDFGDVLAVRDPMSAKLYGGSGDDHLTADRATTTSTAGPAPTC